MAFLSSRNNTYTALQSHIAYDIPILKMNGPPDHSFIFCVCWPDYSTKGHTSEEQLRPLGNRIAPRPDYTTVV